MAMRHQCFFFFYVTALITVLTAYLVLCISLFFKIKVFFKALLLASVFCHSYAKFRFCNGSKQFFFVIRSGFVVVIAYVKIKLA